MSLVIDFNLILDYLKSYESVVLKDFSIHILEKEFNKVN